MHRYGFTAGTAVSLKQTPTLEAVTAAATCHSPSIAIRRRRQRLRVVATQPDPTTPETEKERSPLDYPQVTYSNALR